ncbi:MAG: hypothetical protein QXN87_01070 [Candidatus Bathyarchaeia archaeon]
MKNKMKLVASSQNVSIHCPENGRFSFFNSPYPAHRLCSAVDIYTPTRNFGCEAYAPVSGEVIGLRAVGHFQRRFFECSDRDYVMLIRSLENPNVVVKILHVKPNVNVGDFVSAGEKFGTLLRSGFFDFWTDPHIHLEVRNPSDPLRVRGAYKIDRAFKMEDIKVLGKFAGEVVECNPEYSLIAFKEDLTFGIPVMIGDCMGILDGGIPHYGFFGVHLERLKPIMAGEEVKLCGETLGRVASVLGDTCLVSVNPLRFTVNGVEVGLSLYLNLSKTFLKIVPRKVGELNLKMGDEVRIKMCSFG